MAQFIEADATAALQSALKMIPSVILDIGTTPEERRAIIGLMEDMVLAKPGQYDAASVLNDWCLERGYEGGSAQLHWLTSSPSPFQKNITLAVLNRATSRANWPHLIARCGSHYESVFREATRQLLIHKHAPYVRVISPNAQTSPKHDEALLDLYHHRSGTRKKEVAAAVSWRCRCDALGCVPLSIGRAAPTPNINSLTFEFFVDRKTQIK